MDRRVLSVLALASLLLMLQPALPEEAAYVEHGKTDARIGNDFLELSFDSRSGYPVLMAIQNKRGRSVAFHDEGLRLRLCEKNPREYREITLPSFKLLGMETSDLQKRGKSLSFLLRNEEAAVEVKLCYELLPEDFYIRKRTFVRSLSENAPILLQAELERIHTDAECELGGMGQPVFVGGNLFLALEYPAARNETREGVVSLTHHPGKGLTQEFLELKPEVIGVSKDDQIEAAFAEYRRRVRIPPRSFVVYNSWYDLRRRDLSTEVLEASFDEFRTNLTERYGVGLDSFVIDAGWQKQQSIWETDRTVFPTGLGDIAKYLEKNGSHLGLWMPLTAVTNNLDLQWGKEHGYELSDAETHYCISGTNYNRQLRQMIAHHINDLHLNYYKHDFNAFRCSADGHGHLTTAECGFEANVDAYIEILKYERRLNPEIFINITGGMWLSPWWLMYADAVWRGGSDTGHERTVPFVYIRDDTMTYVDGRLYDDFVKHRYPFPPSALMTCNMVYGKYNMLGGKDEPLHRFAEHVIGHLAPGLMMKELYVSPTILSLEQWGIIGRALLWAERNKDVLCESMMTHGNPHLGELYGFKHVSGKRLIWSLRNPSLRQQTVTLDIAGALGGPARYVELTYPYRKVLNDGAKEAVSEITLDVPPFQSFVVGASLDEKPCLRGVRYSVVKKSESKSSIVLYGRPGSEAVVALPHVTKAALEGKPLALGESRSFRVHFSGRDEKARIAHRSSHEVRNQNHLKLSIPASVVEGTLLVLYEKAARDAPVAKFEVDGKKIKPRVTAGSDWTMFHVSLPEGECEVSFEIPVTQRRTVPFALKPIMASSFLFIRNKLALKELEIQHTEPLFTDPLPTPFAGIDTMCIPLQEREVVSFLARGARNSITSDEMKNIKAAKLHIAGFGIQGEKFLHKPVLLNGEEIGILPLNPRPFDMWREAAMDVPPDRLDLIKNNNVIVFTNPTGDCYKVKDIALAVQLPDGSWVESNMDSEVYCSAGGWPYSEGKLFEKGKSPEISLNFATD